MIETVIIILEVVSKRAAISVTSVRRNGNLSIDIIIVGGAMIETIFINAGSVKVAISVTSVRKSGIMSILNIVAGDVIDTIIISYGSSV
jgi:hypothetical protein